MAQFVGQTAEYLSEKSFNRRLKVLLSLMIGFGIFCYILGSASTYLFGHHTLGAYAPPLAAILLTLLAFRYFDRQIDRHLRLARIEETGAAGERNVLPLLRKLPDTYTVISDLTYVDSYGNIDHLVIGPTGVFSIDVKNWRGLITSNGQGELLINGNSTEKPDVGRFVARSMELKNKIKNIVGLDPYVQCLFVFPRAYVSAKWGETGYVNCLIDEKLVEYITKVQPRTPIPANDISRLVETVTALKNLAPRTPHDPQRIPPPPHG